MQYSKYHHSNASCGTCYNGGVRSGEQVFGKCIDCLDRAKWVPGYAQPEEFLEFNSDLDLQDNLDQRQEEQKSK